MAEKQKRPATKPNEVPARYHTGFLEAMDGRVEAVRTLRQRLSQLMTDLGGERDLSYQEKSLCRRIVHLERLIERREMSMAHGGTVDESVHLASINSLCALFGKIGMKRRAKTIQLSDYLKNKHQDNPAPQGS
jgi:hypothetical protein